MSYKTRLRNLCKTCKYATKRYSGEKVTSLWCVKRNGYLKRQPKACDKYEEKA